jgi:hypothetical protein
MTRPLPRPCGTARRLSFVPGNDAGDKWTNRSDRHELKRHRVEVETLAGRLLPIRYRSSVERESTRQTRTAAEAFVNVAALQTGARLDGKGRSRIARRIAELTGLAQALKEERKLLISEMTYFFEALRPQGRIIGRLNARATGPMAASRDLARALRRNPHLKVFVGSGRYDLGTPYSATDWSLAQLDAPADVLARVQHHYYDAGHMMYTREEDLTQLKADLAGWLGE